MHDAARADIHRAAKESFRFAQPRNYAGHERNVESGFALRKMRFHVRICFSHTCCKIWAITRVGPRSMKNVTFAFDRKSHFIIISSLSTVESNFCDNVYEIVDFNIASNSSYRFRYFHWKFRRIIKAKSRGNDIVLANILSPSRDWRYSRQRRAC